LSRRKALLCGVLAGACFLTKQTIGLGITVVLPVTFMLIAVRRRAVKNVVMFVLYFAIGWAIPVVITWGWLINAGAFSAYLSQNFATGTAAKGSLTEILLRPVVMTFTVYPGVFTVIGALAALAVRITLSCSPA